MHDIILSGRLRILFNLVLLIQWRWVVSIKKDAPIFAMGVAIRWIVNHWFDYLLYPVVLAWLGSVNGGLALIVLGGVVNILLIRAYDWSKTDWFLIEKIKNVGEQTEGGDIEGVPRWFAWLLRHTRKRPTLMFFVLCIDDPITVTLYFRQGSYQFNGMSRKDWYIFLAANVVSNLYWIVGWTAVIEIVRLFFF